MSDFDFEKELADKVEKQGWRIEELERKQKMLITSEICIAVYLAFKLFIQGN